MADLTRVGLNNQKRKISVNVSELADTKDNTFFQLPQNILTTAVTIIVQKADSTSDATVDVTLNGTVVKNEVKVDVVDVTRDVFESGARFFDAGALVEVKAGDTAPAGDGEIILVFEYIELDRTTGEYIPYPEA